ncbi:MAG: hypothetical protein KAS63_11155, partial [Candidatus Heimdallarchaeota archaeon]|nr:hypothetical protein [Candidatus Heimdallarchaeota archaeon]MCK4955915.1 hypothetical protein [Candidatus Heimdallarchaeota archaeon]
LDAQNQIYTPFYLISGYLQDHLLQPMEGTLLTLQINGSFYQTALSDVFGYYEFNITLEPGTYALDIIFLGDSNYLGSNESRLVHIWKIDTVLQGVVLWQNLTLIIDAYLNDSYDNPLQNMVIEFYLNGSLEGQNQTDSSGYTQFLISDVLPGVYEIEIVFRGDDIHEQSSQLIVMEQQKEQTELIVKIYEGIYATLATRIEIRLTSNNLPLENQNILLRINGQDIFGLTNSSGYVLISLDLFSDASFYNLEIFYAGDSVYSSIFYNSNFSILKAQTSIDLSFYYQNYQPWLSGLLQGPTLLSTETVTIKVNDTVYLVLITDSLGEFLTQIGLVAGNYLVTVSFDGSNNYHATSTSIEITIFKTPTQILFDGDFNQTFSTEFIIEIQLLDILGNPMQADIIISLDGNYYVTVSTNTMGFAFITLLSDIPVDFHQITVTYQGDGFYYQSSKIIDFYTKYSIELVDLVSLPSSYGQEGIIEGKINTFRGLLQGVDINLLINGENLLVQADSQGYFIFYLNQNLEAGTYLAQIRVDENIGILYFEFSFSIDRDKGPVDITVNPLVMVFNKVTIIGGTVAFQGDEISNALVSIHINGNNFGSIVTDIDGNFIIPNEWMQLSPGTYNLTIFVILNDPNIEDTVVEFAFEILKDNPESMIAWENNVVEEELVLIITFIDSNGQLIPFHEFSVEVNGTIIAGITDGNGYNQIFYPILSGNILVIEVYSEESIYYFEYLSSFNIPVEKCDSYLKLENNKVYYNSTSGITLTLLSKNNNSIENALILVYIDQKEYIYYTNSSGQISINIMGLNVGNYSLAIYFEGNLSYNFTKLEFNAEIIPQTTIINYVKEENQIVIELLDGENRSLSNKDILVQYVDSDRNTLNEETLTTDQFGRITIVLNFNEISRQTKSLNLLFEGDNLYKKYEILVTLLDLINQSKNLLASSGALQTTLAILGLFGLVSLRHLLRRKKKFSK